MCKAQQSYLPYLTAVDSGVLPLDITIQPCAGYMLAYNAATCDTSHLLPACSITEPTLFDVSHCPIFKLTPIFVSKKDFVVLDFASLPKVDTVHHMGVGGSSGTAGTPIVEGFQKRSGSASTTANLQNAHEIAKSYSDTANTPTVDAFQMPHNSSGTKINSDTGLLTVDAARQTNHKLKSKAMEKSLDTILGKTKTKPVDEEIEILTSKDRGEWIESSTDPLNAIIPLTTTNRSTINSSKISPITLKKIVYSPRTLRSIGRGMLSPGKDNMAMNLSCIVTGEKTVKHERINSACPTLENIKEEDMECQNWAAECLEEADSMSKEL